MVGKTSGFIHTRLLNTESSLNKTINRIASGKKIQTASDDPAGLSALMATESQTRGLSQQIYNRQDEISMIQTAEGAMGTINDTLGRINELTVQASNGTLTDTDRQAIQEEINQLNEQINMTANNTQYNTKNLLDGSLNVKLQNGNKLAISAVNTETLGLDSIDVTTQSGAENAISSVQNAISAVTSSRSDLGAVTNGITSDINNLNSQLLSALKAQSNIGDADMAQEIINLNRDQLSSEAAIKAFKMQDDASTTVLSLLS